MNRYSSLGVPKLAGKRVSMASALGHGLWSFLKHYIFKLGFIDGWAGFVIAFGNFEGTFYRYAKRYEETQDWQPPKSEVIAARRVRLQYEASSPVFFGRPRVGRIPDRPRPSKSEGARDAKGPDGPAGLDASRHRGLSKSVLPQVRQSDGVPRAVFLGLLRSAPGGRTFQATLLSFRIVRPPIHRSGPGRAGKPVTGCRPRHHGARWRAAGAPGRLRLEPPGRAPHLRLRRHSPATAPCLMSEDAVQTPLGIETGCAHDTSAFSGEDKFFEDRHKLRFFRQIAGICRFFSRGAAPRKSALPFAQAARKIAQPAERQRQIIFAQISQRSAKRGLSAEPRATYQPLFS